MKPAVDAYFKAFEDSHYKQGIAGIEHRWEKFIELNEEYVEKYRAFPNFMFSLLGVYFWDYLRTNNVRRVF